MCQLIVLDILHRQLCMYDIPTSAAILAMLTEYCVCMCRECQNTFNCSYVNNIIITLISITLQEYCCVHRLYVQYNSSETLKIVVSLCMKCINTIYRCNYQHITDIYVILIERYFLAVEVYRIDRV